MSDFTGEKQNLNVNTVKKFSPRNLVCNVIYRFIRERWHINVISVGNDFCTIHRSMFISLPTQNTKDFSVLSVV